MKGTIFNIQRFSLDDGPGIRTIVFLKGCNQKCLWCHNPESISMRPEIMRMDSLCTRCGKCKEACLNNSIVYEDGMMITKPESCIRCEKCIQICPNDSIKMVGKEVEIEDVMQIIRKDRVYYEETHGGITISGGEPTVQCEFLKELLLACKKENFHVAIETNGNTDLNILEGIVPYIDLALVDLKHVDDEKHQKFTGASNKRCLNSIRYYTSHVSTEIRIPLIPTFNDTVQELNEMFAFIRECGSDSVTILPYHTFGISKYKNLGQKYSFGMTENLETCQVEKLISKADKQNLMVKVKER